MRFEREQLLELAELVADAIERRQAVAATPRLVTPAELAERLGVSRAYVYEHAGDLGAIRLPASRRADERRASRGANDARGASASGEERPVGEARPRLLFDPVEAARRLASCQAGRGSSASDPAQAAAPKRRRRRGSGTSVPLLPIRGLDSVSQRRGERP